MTEKREKKVVKKQKTGESKTSSLPSIQQLAKDAWELFKRTWVAYLKLVGLSLAYVFVALLIGLLISLPITFVAIGSHVQLFNHLTPFNIATLVLLFVWSLLFLLSLVVIEILFPIVGIFILQGKKASPIFDLIRQAKRFFWPYFLTVLLSSLAAFGATILLVIPGLLLAYLFAFVTFEVVVEGQSGPSALQRSYFMVKTHFWEVLGRLVVLELAVIIISSVLGKAAAGDGLLGLVQFLFSLFASWYARAYVFLLYKEVRARTTFPQTASLRWIWIVSGVGWLVIVLLIAGLAVGASYLHGMQPSQMHRVSPGAV